jgi:hypothetical protein
MDAWCSGIKANVERDWLLKGSGKFLLIGGLCNKPTPAQVI